MIEQVRPHVGNLLERRAVGDSRPSITIAIPGARMNDADIREVDDEGFTRYFMGRLERYLWVDVADITTTTITI
tara:strand:- start:68 stop:289 length:222 start_codon:yes stop_codon:yes gene_type:complete